MRDYENSKLVSDADILAKEIQGAKGEEDTREHFFCNLIDRMQLKVCAEVGVDQGLYSKYNLDNCPSIQKYILVNCWQNPEREQTARNNLEKYFSSGVIEVRKGMSVDMAKEIPDNSLDFCYIDGDHSLEGIFYDVRAFIPKVKIGGIIAGHDYKDSCASWTLDWFGRQLTKKVKVVVDDFGLRYGYKVNSVGRRLKNWWFVKNREAEVKPIFTY